jgi:hypothetical protein
MDELMEGEHIERCRQEWEASKKQGGVELVTMSWLDDASAVDPELVAKEGPNGGMAGCCWNCGMHGGAAAAEEIVLLTCTRYERSCNKYVFLLTKSNVYLFMMQLLRPTQNTSTS